MSEQTYKIQRPIHLSGSTVLGMLTDGDVGYIAGGGILWTGKEFYTNAHRYVMPESDTYDVRVFKKEGVTYFEPPENILKYTMSGIIKKKDFPSGFKWKQICLPNEADKV